MLLHSQTLQFGGDGAVLAVADPGGATIAMLDRDARPARVEQPGVAAIAVFPNSVWTLDETRRHVQRWTHSGQAVGATKRLAAGPCTNWTIAPTGSPAVLMDGSRRTALVEEGGELIEVPSPGRGLAVPITGRRSVLYQDDVLRLGNGRLCRLAEGVTPIGGAILFGGQTVVLVVVDRTRQRGMVVLSIDSGRVQGQFSLPEGELRIAAERGHTAVRTDARRLVIVDLRSGRIHAEVRTPLDLDDFAIDPAAKRIAIRAGNAVEIHPVADLTGRARPERQLTLHGDPRSDRIAPQPTAASAPAAEVEPAPPEAIAVVEQREQAPLAMAMGSTGTTPPGGGASGGSGPGWLILKGSGSASPTSNYRAGGGAGSGARRPGPSSPTTHAAGTSNPSPRVVDLFELRGFGTARRTTAAPAEIERVLDLELRTVTLRALVAIARGWDTRAIGFPNEGVHPYEQEVAALVGMNEGHAPDKLQNARAQLEEHERTLADDHALRAPDTPLGQLADELSLSPLALDILMVVAAPSLRGELGRLYRVLASDPRRARVDELLVEQILAGRRDAVARELASGAPLRLYGVIHVGPGDRSEAALSVDPVVLARLRGEPVDLGPGAPTSVRTCDRHPSELLLPSELVLAATRYLSHEPACDRQARIALRGRPGSGGKSLLAALAAKADRDVGVIDATRLPHRLDTFLDALRVELGRVAA